ncbi:ferritin [Nocardia sp. NBC_01329]|uniref:ferritin n=1 Tax=Nocardia sp. NBC_01329 TaxID=2903594 RepID=UPI002E0E4144|nr:ferritin-like domain-containing protein [Nocardia sp. NBC_01329]
MHDSELAQPFIVQLRAQVRHGLTASQQYLAAAVYFDIQRLPQLSGHCYLRSEQHRGHALRIVQYLIDRDLEITIGGLGEVRQTFESPRAAIAFLLAREETLTDQVTELARLAREWPDFLGEQFMSWLLECQQQDVAGMSTLLAVTDRSAGNLFDVEEFVARELRSAVPAANYSVPKMAGAGRNQ